MSQSCSDNNAGIWVPLSWNLAARSEFGADCKVRKALWCLGQLASFTYAQMASAQIEISLHHAVMFPTGIERRQ